MFKNISGNNPGGNFLGGNFPGGGSLLGGSFPGVIFLILMKTNEVSNATGSW